MKIRIGMCHVIEETAQSTIIIVTIIIIIIVIIISFIIIIIIITNTITTIIQASVCCKWQMFLSQRAPEHVTEQASSGKSKNLDNLTNCRGSMSSMVKLNKSECIT
jgi:uncharacterized protein YqfA (UPF0365 family)